MTKKLRDAYCKKCGKIVQKLRRTPLASGDWIVVVVITIATFGLMFILVLLFLLLKRKNKCPNCYAKVDFIEKSQKEKLESTEESNVDPEYKKTYCPYCSERLLRERNYCPYCETSLKKYPEIIKGPILD